MIQLLSLALFTSVLVISIAAIVATVKAELPYILRALGVEPTAMPPLRPTGERRARIMRQAKLAPPSAYRAAA